MKTNSKEKSTNVSRPNVLLIGLICLFTGFLIGVGFTSYKLKANPSPVAQQGGDAVDPGNRERSLKTELSINPGNISAWIQLGHLYYDTDQYQNAVQAYEKALSLDPGNADVLTDLGVMYRRTHNPEKAVASFDRAIAADPAHETARFNKGIVLMHDLNQKEKALSVWEALLEINPIFMVRKDQSLDQLILHYKDH